MINNLTPEDQKAWDKSMSSYQQKLDKNADAFKWLLLIISVLFIIGGSMYACHEMKTPKPPPPSLKINTGWIEEHSEIKRGDVVPFVSDEFVEKARRDRL